MKLSKYTTLTITSASAIIYGFGVAVNQVGAEVLVTDEVANQIEQALGEADYDEMLVDGLTQIEYEIKALGVSGFSLNAEDTELLAELKLKRIGYIEELRSRLSSLTGAERQDFLERIRTRRRAVRQELKEIRAEKVEEIKEARVKFKENVKEQSEKLREHKQEMTEKREEEMKKAKEKFKENLQQAKQTRLENKREAKEKFAERVKEIKVRREEEAKNPEELEKRTREKNESLKKVQGAVDYQPVGWLEKIGFWFEGL